LIREEVRGASDSQLDGRGEKGKRENRATCRKKKTQPLPSKEEKETFIRKAQDKETGTVEKQRKGGGNYQLKKISIGL